MGRTSGIDKHAPIVRHVFTSLPDIYLLATVCEPNNGYVSNQKNKKGNKHNNLPLEQHNSFNQKPKHK
jgi:hypothetical protein